MSDTETADISALEVGGWSSWMTFNYSEFFPARLKTFLSHLEHSIFYFVWINMTHQELILFTPPHINLVLVYRSRWFYIYTSILQVSLRVSNLSERELLSGNFRKISKAVSNISNKEVFRLWWPFAKNYSH